MIRNTNDKSGDAPRLRIDLNLGTLGNLPTWCTGPRGSLDEIFSAIREAGYEGIQADPDNVALAEKYGLSVTTSGRVDRVEDADALACKMKDAGTQACTVHVGIGFENDSEVDRLVGAIIAASTKYDYPIYLETHRATITQDCWRTLQIIRRHPEIRFNGDFSHWYTGLEMVYGGFDRKLQLLQPVFERVRFIHGRIGNPGSMQVPVQTNQNDDQPFVQHFRQMWKACYQAFKNSASKGDFICFAPELLPSTNFYARIFEQKEESDRWQQAKVLSQIARECFNHTV